MGVWSRPTPPASTATARGALLRRRRRPAQRGARAVPARRRRAPRSRPGRLSGGQEPSPCAMRSAIDADHIHFADMAEWSTAPRAHPAAQDPWPPAPAAGRGLAAGWRPDRGGPLSRCAPSSPPAETATVLPADLATGARIGEIGDAVPRGGRGHPVPQRRRGDGTDRVPGRSRGGGGRTARRRLRRRGRPDAVAAIVEPGRVPARDRRRAAGGGLVEARRGQRLVGQQLDPAPPAARSAAGLAGGRDDARSPPSVGAEQRRTATEAQCRAPRAPPLPLGEGTRPGPLRCPWSLPRPWRPGAQAVGPSRVGHPWPAVLARKAAVGLLLANAPRLLLAGGAALAGVLVLAAGGPPCLSARPRGSGPPRPARRSARSPRPRSPRRFAGQDLEQDAVRRPRSAASPSPSRSRRAARPSRPRALGLSQRTIVPGSMPCRGAAYLAASLRHPHRALDRRDDVAGVRHDELLHHGRERDRSELRRRPRSTARRGSRSLLDEGRDLGAHPIRIVLVDDDQRFVFSPTRRARPRRAGWQRPRVDHLDRDPVLPASSAASSARGRAARSRRR